MLALMKENGSLRIFYKSTVESKNYDSPLFEIDFEDDGKLDNYYFLLESKEFGGGYNLIFDIELHNYEHYDIAEFCWGAALKDYYCIWAVKQYV